MLSSNQRLNLCYFKIIHFLHPHYHPINNRTYSKKKKSKCVCIHEIIRLIIMRIKMTMKNLSHRYNIYRPRSRDMGTNVVNITVSF